MRKTDISEDIIKEVEELIDIGKEATIIKEATLIFDGRQFSIKIPKEVAETVGITPNDKITFLIHKYPIEDKKKPELGIQLKRENAQETTTKQN